MGTGIIKFVDILNKIPDSRGGYYSTKAGLWKAMNVSENKIENCKNIVSFLMEKM